MKTLVQKWAKGFALRIPNALAEEAGLRANSLVDVSLVNGTLIVRAVAPQSVTLMELMREVTDENIPLEWQTGATAGNELW
ncbi:MAG: AbrB/MazE/SpoVT family DNA-binding domain-containing protein [Planctomycetes bacterium]|nr:AbrB/MazE/SpoVT family DNA-binding domain-containing protein [Planctomycetota bacterium]